MKKSKEKKEQITKIFVAVVAAIFMLSSVGYVVLTRSDSQAQNPDKFSLELSNGKYEFSKQQDQQGNIFYNVKSLKSSFSAYYLPQELSKKGISNDTLAFLQQQQFFYLIFDPDDKQISYSDYFRFELRKNMPADRIFEDGETNISQIYSYPVITCKNATNAAPVVYLKSANSTNIYLAGNCVYFNYAPYDFIRLRDILVYTLQGVKV